MRHARISLRRRIWIAAAIVVVLLLLLPFVLASQWATYDQFLKDWQAWYGVLIGFVGLAVITDIQLSFTREEAERHRDEDRDGLIRVLYFEVYNRAARIALDARTWNLIVSEQEEVPLSRFRKFRPTEPVIFPGNANRLSLLPPKALSPLMMFYFRLDAMRRDVDRETGDLDIVDGPDVPEKRILADSEIKAFARRFREAVRPALDSLNELGTHISNRREVDEQLQIAHANLLDGREIRSALSSIS